MRIVRSPLGYKGPCLIDNWLVKPVMFGVTQRSALSAQLDGVAELVVCVVSSAQYLASYTKLAPGK